MNTQRQQNTRDIFLLLTRSGSFFSRVIHTATKEEYTHVSIGVFNSYEFYSFARRHTRLPLPAGFVKERLDSGLLAKSTTAPCALYRLTVPEKSYRSISRRIKKMLRKQRAFHYSILGTFFCFFGKSYRRENKYFCSQFVAETLENSGAVKLERLPELYHPVDLMSIPQLELCFKGTLGELRENRLAVAGN